MDATRDTDSPSRPRRADERPAGPAPARTGGLPPHDDATSADDRLGRPLVRGLLAAAVGTGAVADVWMRDRGLGLNVTLVLLAAIAAQWVVTRARTSAPTREATLLLLAGAGFATLFAIRDQGLLAFGNLVASALLIGLAVAVAAPESTLTLVRTRLRDVSRAIVDVAFGVVLGSFRFVWNDLSTAVAIPARHRYATTLVVRAGVLAGVVALPVFILLAAGDPVFASLIERIFDLPVDLQRVVNHVVVTLAFAFPMLGLLGAGVRPLPERTDDDTRIRRLSRLDVTAVLGTVNVLLAGFVGVQARALFGGREYVMATTGLTFAAYARHGFFTLVTLGFFALGLLLALHPRLREDSDGAEVTFRRQATALMVLVGIVLASAVTRMALYVTEWGLTLDRLYALGAMGWLGVTFVLYRLTVLGAAPRRFVGGAFAAALATLASMNALDPEVFALRHNLARAAAGADFDVEWAARALGADAAPDLVAAMVDPEQRATLVPRLGERGRACAIAGMLVMRWGSVEPDGLGGQTLASWRARTAVRAHVGELRALVCPPNSAASDAR
ncbi:MAG: DUF4173 domain-containing protein [Gemmatimonadetes bacterium]|nr:DUF4173 domain-containing protein [Gemmatimonadota bacterium]